MENKLISFSDIAREFVGQPLTNGQALELIKAERNTYYNHLQQMKETKTSTWRFQEIANKAKLVMAFDILIDSFEQYLNHEK